MREKASDFKDLLNNFIQERIFDIDLNVMQRNPEYIEHIKKGRKYYNELISIMPEDGIKLLRALEEETDICRTVASEITYREAFRDAFELQCDLDVIDEKPIDQEKRSSRTKFLSINCKEVRIMNIKRQESTEFEILLKSLNPEQVKRLQGLPMLLGPKEVGIGLGLEPRQINQVYRLFNSKDFPSEKDPLRIPKPRFLRWLGMIKEE